MLALIFKFVDWTHFVISIYVDEIFFSKELYALMQSLFMYFFAILKYYYEAILFL